MLKTGHKYKPSSMRTVKGGLTQFSIPQTHFEKGNGYVRDGFINVLCKGSYPWIKDCDDHILIKQINGVSIRTMGDRLYCGIVAEIEYLTAREASLQKEGGGSWDDDIPEELL